LSRGLNPPKSAKTWFKFSAGLNLETFDTLLSGTNSIFKPRLNFKPPLKFFKFGHWKEKEKIREKINSGGNPVVLQPASDQHVLLHSTVGVLKYVLALKNEQKAFFSFSAL